MAKRDPKHDWIKTVKTDTVVVPKGAMTKSPQETARLLIRANLKLQRPMKSINQFIQYHINRAGHGMSEERKEQLRKAMEIVRQKAKRINEQGKS